MVFLIAVPNIIGLYLYAPEIKKDLADYLQRYWCKIETHAS